MNRWLMAALIGLTMTSGCAVGVEDPLPAPAPIPEKKAAPPTETFSAEVEDDSEEADVTLDLPPLPQQKPPKPGE